MPNINASLGPATKGNKRTPYEKMRSRLPNSFFAVYLPVVHKVIVTYTNTDNRIIPYVSDMPKDSSQKPAFYKVNVDNPCLYSAKKLFKVRAGWEDEIRFYIMHEEVVQELPCCITTPSRMLPALKHGMYTPPKLILSANLKTFDEQIFHKENMEAVRKERMLVNRMLITAINEIEGIKI